MQSIKNIFTDFQTPAIMLLTAFAAMTVNAAGQPVLKIGQYCGCKDHEVLIPVDVKNLEDIAAFTLYVKVDTNVVEYVGVENINEAFLTGSLIGNLAEGRIILSWFSTASATIDSGVMCNIRLLLKDNETMFEFDNESEFVRSDLSVVENIQYENGWLSSIAGIRPSPAEISGLEGVTVTFEVNDFEGTNSYQWQQLSGDNVWFNLNDDNTFAGVHSNQLNIIIDYTLNNTEYRCEISHDSCVSFTHESLLSVIPSGISNHSTEKVHFSVFPNPSSVGYVTIKTEKEISVDRVEFRDLTGKTIMRSQLNNSNGSNVINLDNIKNGYYFVQLFYSGLMVGSTGFVKE